MELEEKEEAYRDAEMAERSSVTCNNTKFPNCSTGHQDWIELYDDKAEAIIVPCVFALILVVGVLGNVLLILPFARHKKLSTPHNALVVNLASGDLIFLTVSLPFNSVWYTIPYWPFGLTICKLSHFAESLATAVVISTLSVLSIERCLIVTGKKLWRQQQQGAVVLTLTIWIISILFSVPNLISANIVEEIINGETYPFCFLYDKQWVPIYTKIHVICKFILLFCLPLLVIATAYTITAFHLLLRAFPGSQKPVKTDKQKDRIPLQKMGSKTKKEDNGSNPSVDVGQNDTTKTANSTEKRGPLLDAKTNDTSSKSKKSEQPSPKAKSAPKKDEEKSSSPDSCTEMTELNQTPVLPYAFVYTGPIPEGAQQMPEPRHNKSTLSTPKPEAKSDGTFGGSSDAGTTSWKETTPLNPPSSSNETKSRYRPKQRQATMVTKRRRLALTVLMLIVAFAVCWTPRHVYLLWYHVLPGNFDAFWYVFKIIGFCLSSSNSAVNPVVFYVLDAKYRSFVHKVLCFICLRTCHKKRTPASDAAVTIAERDYNATIAMTEMRSKGNVTEL